MRRGRGRGAGTRIPLGIAGIFCSGRLGRGLGVVDASIVACFVDDTLRNAIRRSRVENRGLPSLMRRLYFYAWVAAGDVIDPLPIVFPLMSR